MKNAVTIDDAKNLTKDDIFDLEGAYVDMLKTTVRDNRQGFFHPSGVGRCGRANVYEYIRAPRIETIDPESLETFDMGHAVHALVGSKLADVSRVLKPRKIGYELQTEVPYDPKWDKLFVDFGIVGTTDALLKIWADEWTQRSAVEVKSIKEQQFDKLNGPKEDHLQQAHLYAYRFDCPIIYIWYYCKNNSKRRVYPEIFNPDVLNKALAKFQGWLQHAEAGTLPDREESWWACPRCEYREICQPQVLVQLRSKQSNRSLSGVRSRGRL